MDNANQPTTRQDMQEAVRAITGAVQAGITASEQRTNARIDQLEQRTNARIEQLEDRTNARIERVETSLLTEFHKWASPAEARAKTHAAVLRVIDAETEFPPII